MTRTEIKVAQLRKWPRRALIALSLPLVMLIQLLVTWGGCLGFAVMETYLAQRELLKSARRTW